MDCLDENLVAAFVQGKLSSERSVSVEDHIAECEVCRTLISTAIRCSSEDSADSGERLLVTPARSTFGVGDIVANRYRILRFVARGGMGEVYEAEDVELSLRIALKTIRADIAAEDGVLDHLKRELALARRVTHRGVCRIYDLGFHQMPDDPSDPPRIAFLTMEFLDGETLDSRLRREGRLPPSAALPIIEQMAAALEAAHRAGVIHRDFKSSNVMLVPLPSGVVRVVVTDFGLARDSSIELPSSMLSGLINPEGSGSPAYMAPEQVEARPTTTASDIYALGVVMYRMVTGQWPFLDETPQRTALRRLQEDPVAPREHIPDLDPRWNSAIMRCLARDPALRFQSANDLIEHLRGGAKARQLRRRKLAISIASLFLIGIGVFAGVRFSRTGSDDGVDRAQRRAVAILGFKNLSGRSEVSWISIALAEMLATELSNGNELRLISGEQIARMRADLNLGDTDSLSAEALKKIHDHSGADWIIMGAYVASGSNGREPLRVDLQLQDTKTAAPLVRISESGAQSELIALAARLEDRLKSALKLSVPTPIEQGPASPLPNSTEAAKFYAEGLDRLRHFDASEAQKLLERAVALDTSYAPAHAALAAAWIALGHDPKARGEAKAAFELAGRLNREESLAVEARYREINNEWARAIEIYQALIAFFPDNIDYALLLAAAQTVSAKATDAIKTLTTARQRIARAGEDPTVDLAEAKAHQALGDCKLADQAIDRALAQGRRRENRLVVAQAQLVKGRTARCLGEIAAANKALEGAEQLFRAAGDQAGAARALLIIGQARFEESDLEGARQSMGRSLESARQIGDRRGTATALSALASVFHGEGKLSESVRRRSEALALFREQGNRSLEAINLALMGGMLALQGDLRAAERFADEALVIARETVDRRVISQVQAVRADTFLLQAKLPEVRTCLAEFEQLSRSTGHKSFIGYAARQWADLHLVEDRLDLAQQRIEEAISLHSAIGSTAASANFSAVAADIQLAANRPREALQTAAMAVAELKKGHHPTELIEAQAVLATVQAALGDLQAARTTADQAYRGAEPSENRLLFFTAAIALTKVLTAEGKYREAVRRLDALEREAKKCGLIVRLLELRTIRASIEMRMGVPAARRRLAAIAEEARSLGALRVARSATESAERWRH